MAPIEIGDPVYIEGNNPKDRTTLTTSHHVLLQAPVQEIQAKLESQANR